MAVHGLGANPKTIWNGSEKDDTTFNWLKDKGGLQTDFPNSRIMKYKYASAYQGAYKIDQRLEKISSKLLDALQDKRDRKGKEVCPIFLSLYDYHYDLLLSFVEMYDPAFGLYWP